MVVCDSSLQMKNARQEHTTFLAVQDLHNKTACKTRTRLISRSRTRQERAKLFESTLSLVVRNLHVHENWTHLRENVNAVASPIPKNGSLSRNLIGLKSFGLFTKISGLLPVKPSRASGIPRTLKEIHWSVITIGILRNGNLKNSSFPKSGIKDCSLFYFALCIVHKSNYSLFLFNEVKIFIKVKLGKPLSLSIEVFIVLLLEFVCQ